MNGKKLREKLKLCEISLREVARLLNISEQNLQQKLSADDIKVSFLLELSEKLNKNISFFLDDTQKNISIGDNSIFGNNLNHANIDNRHYYSDSPDVLRAQIDILEERIKEKDAQIKEKDAQIKEKDAQINKLLSILDKK
ncbi:MAG: helix-turn-helix domain-containing protein [Bacteroidales bacterium]|jgi:transcriptional regulator with XRE-family HTH domain|nr:helix-turn-helix domain-containing protein [Bacteroidales bacterium]